MIQSKRLKKVISQLISNDVRLFNGKHFIKGRLYH
jgi:hypothetical protein